MKAHKRLSALSLLGVLVLLFSLVSVAPASAASAGVISLNKTFVTTPSAAGTIEVTLTDSDLDIAALQTNEATDYSGVANTYLFPFTANNDAGLLSSYKVKIAPIMDSNGDGIVNFSDVTASISDLNVYTVDASNGIVTLQAKTGEASTSATPFTLTYKSAGVQTTGTTWANGAVKVTSTTDTNGFVIQLKETSSNSGIFKGTFSTGTSTSATGADDAANSTRPTIAAVSGAIVTVSYKDASPAATKTATTSVETTKPVVSVVSPSTGSSTQNVNPKLVVNVTDSDSTVDKTTIAFNVSGATAGSITTTAIAGGFQAETTLTGLVAGTTAVTWNVTANDKAGNTGTSDSNATTAGNQDHSLSVDTVAPNFSQPVGAETGHFWDTTLTTTDKNQATATKGLSTSIRLLFDEDLDCSTVQTTDFTVDTVMPAAVDCYDAASDQVYLTVVAFAANKKQIITLAGPISDPAGNSRSTSAIIPTAADGIAPTITVSTTPVLHKTATTIEVASDEPLLTAPAITQNGSAQSAPSLVGTNTFQLKITDSTAGVKNIVVAVQDTAGNAANKGNATNTNTAAILYEIDNALPAVSSTSPANNGTVYTTSPFFSIDWTSEGSEYTGDTHKAVTLSKLTLDGTDVLASVSSTDNVKFILSTSDLALGDHTVKFNATDEAGNVLSADVSVKFTVKTRPALSISLNPGWNLISLPASPADPDVNAVINSTHSIGNVVTYDADHNAITAQRVNGLLEGGVTTIDSNTAYYVHTESFQALTVTLASADPGAPSPLPQVLNLSAGWNLIPVLSADPAVTGSSTVISADYLPAGCVRVFAWSTLDDKYTAQSCASGTLSVGSGYWVYMSKAGDIVAGS
jgi:hypothetical protein